MVETTSGILCPHALNPEADDKNDKEKRLSCGRKIGLLKKHSKKANISKTLSLCNGVDL